MYSYRFMHFIYKKRHFKTEKIFIRFFYVFLIWRQAMENAARDLETVINYLRKDAGFFVCVCV